MSLEDKYTYDNVSLYKIRNKNEIRVIDLLPQVMAEFIDFNPDALDIEDIYALTLNTLPARYAQTGSIVLREEVKVEDIKNAIRSAADKVINHPKH